MVSKRANRPWTRLINAHDVQFRLSDIIGKTFKLGIGSRYLEQTGEHRWGVRHCGFLLHFRLIELIELIGFRGCIDKLLRPQLRASFQI